MLFTRQPPRNDPNAGVEDALMTEEGILLSETLEIKSESEEEQVITSGSVRLRIASRVTSKNRNKVASRCNEAPNEEERH